MTTDRERFFVLRPARSADRSFAWTDDAAMKSESVQCSRFGSLQLRRLTPLVLRTLPAIHDDFMWSWYHDVVATERAKAQISAARLTGCSFAEAAVSRERGEPTVPGRLWELSVDGFAGFGRRAGLSARDWCCEHEALSFQRGSSLANLFDEAKWDGADIFVIWPYPMIRICTARFADALDSAGLTGIRCVPIAEFEFASDTAAPGPPAGSLSAQALLRLERDPDYLDVLREVCGSWSSFAEGNGS
jgi:hypothetical protein